MDRVESVGRCGPETVRGLEAAGPFGAALRRLRTDVAAMAGIAGLGAAALAALAAPLLSNALPLMVIDHGGSVSFPFLRTFFAPDSPERLIEQTFNYLLLLLPVLAVCRLSIRPRLPRRAAYAVLAALILVPFCLGRPKLERRDYRRLAGTGAATVLFAPIAFGPFETAAAPYEAPSLRHWLGADEIGRDVASRLLYGARASLAVGLGASFLSLVIGTAIGLACGYWRGWFDLCVMRLVEVVMCFPTFLLLLIFMVMLGDRKFEQSILIVIAVIGLTGWIGLAFLVRGEVLKQRALPYIQSCETAGIPAWRTMLVHLLPNIAGIILINFTFGVAGAILSESGLSFLGFGVQPPTASWGGLLRQASEDPLGYWHMTVFPGLALFWTLCSFNFTGEGLRRAFALR